MIRLPNGSEYKTILLDTNAIRSMLDEDTDFLYQYLNEFISKEPHAIVISIYSIIELKPLEDIFENFLGLFDIFPFFLVFPYESIVKKEYDNFLNNKKLELCNDIVYAVSSVRNTIIEVNTLFFEGIIDPGIEKFVSELTEITNEWNMKKDAYKSIQNTSEYRKHELEIIIKDIINHIGVNNSLYYYL